MDIVGEWGAAMIDTGINVYNACVKLLYGILLADPSGSKSSSTPSDIQTAIASSWAEIVNGNAYAVLIAIGSALAIVFFITGYCKESIDITKISNFEANISIYLRLIIGVGLVATVSQWLPRAASAGVGVGMKMFKSSGSVAIKATSGSDIIADMNVGVAFVFGMIMMVVLIACGAGLLFIALQRLMKLVLYACLAPVMLSTITGGSGINRSASIWIRTFLSVCFSNSIILIAICISSKFVGANILGSEANSILQAITIIVEVVTVIGFIKVADGILERLLGA